MSLQFITGCSGAGKSTYLYKKIIRESIENPLKNYLIIVPEQFTLAAQKELVRLHPAHCIMNIDILSFNRLAYRVFDELGRIMAPSLADTGKNMVLRRIVEAHKDELGVFGRNYNKQGFISEIKSFISELYQYSVTPEYIQDFIERNPVSRTIRGKLKEIHLIYKEFEEFLGEKYITAEEMSDILAGVIDESGIVRQSIVCMDGFTGFTPSQMNLVTKIMKLSQKTYVTLTLDPAKDVFKETSLFYLAYKTKLRLIKAAGHENISVDDDIRLRSADGKYEVRFSADCEIGFLEKNIFRYPRQKYGSVPRNISLCSMMTARDEIDIVADEIVRLVSGGYKYRDIAVVCGDMEIYSRIAVRVFEKKGIPCFVDYKKKILNNPYVEMLSSVFEIVKTGYSFDAVFRFVRCPMSGIDKEQADLVENYAIAAGIRYRNMWNRTWSSQFRRNYEDRMEEINDIRRNIWQKISCFSEIFKQSAAISEYVKAAVYISEQLECEKMLAGMADGFAGMQEYIYEKEYDKVYECIMELFSQMNELLGDVVVTFDEFVRIFEAGVAEIKVGVIPMTTDQVVIGDIERTRLERVKVMFMIGTNDGLIPKTEAGGTVMSEIERESLSELGFELAPTRRQASFIGQYYLYINITKPSDRLYISYARMDDNARQINPSYLISQIMGIFPKIRIISNKEQFREDGKEYLFEGISQRNRRALGSKWNEVLSWNLGKQENIKDMEMMLNAAFDEKGDTPLAAKTADALYGNSTYSVSRLERFASCAYAHFLRYGLGLNRRDEYEIMLPDMGIIFHEAMERFADELRERKLAWADIDKEMSDSIMEASVQRAVDGFENGILHDSKRNEYRISQIDRIAKRTGWTLCRHVAAGSFVPTGFEVKFVRGLGSDMDSGVLGGVVDRIDTYDADDGKLIKIIDYKSGNRHFDTALFKEGISIQLIVYMNAAVKHETDKGNKCIPAGAFYFRFNDPIIDIKNGLADYDDSGNLIGFDDDKIAEEIQGQMKITGIVNSDEDIIRIIEDDAGFDEKNNLTAKTMSVKTDVGSGRDITGAGVVTTEQFAALMNYEEELINRMNREIKKGVIKRNPYRYGDKNSCEYCEFSSVCRYGGNDTPFRNIQAVNLNGFLNDISGNNKDESEVRGYGVDGVPEKGN